MNLAEKEMFSSKKALNDVVDGYIEQNKVFDFLELGTRRFLYRKLTMKEIDYCLDSYNLFMKYEIRPEPAKRMAMSKTLDFIYYSERIPMLKDLADRIFGDRE
jgi:hypothetical protein